MASLRWLHGDGATCDASAMPPAPMPAPPATPPPASGDYAARIGFVVELAHNVINPG